MVCRAGFPACRFRQSSSAARHSPGLRCARLFTRNSSSSLPGAGCSGGRSVSPYADSQNHNMKTLRCLLVVFLGLAGCRVTTSFAADSEFNGLGLNLGNLYRVSKAQSRSISPENFTGEKGKAGMATEGTGKNAARELGQGWKVSPSVHIKAGTHLHAGRNRRARLHPADLDDARRQLAALRSSASTGTTRPSPRSNAPSATSSPAAGASIARSTRCRCA